jgi:uncharacterized protein (TIGR03435 family)
MTRLGLTFVFAAGLFVVPQAQVQRPDTTNPPRFEVVSIRPAPPDQRGGGGFFPNRFSMSNVTLLSLIQFAYDLKGYQLVNNGPAWINSDRFVIDARTAEPPPTRTQIHSMVQAVLAERFKLTVRRETRETAIYTMDFSRADRRLGPQLRKSQIDCSTQEGRNRAMAILADGRKPCYTMMSPGFYRADGVDFIQLTNFLSGAVGRPLTDRTGLSGLFDWELTWADAPEVDGPALVTAFEEQLGLKLQSARGPVEMLIVESAERPTPN